MLDALTDKQREVFILYYKEGYTQQQIADMLGITKQSVGERLSTAVSRVKNFLRKFEDNPYKLPLARQYMRGLDKSLFKTCVRNNNKGRTARSDPLLHKTDDIV